MPPANNTALPDDPLATMLAALRPAERDTDQQEHCRAAAAAVLLRSLDAQEPIGDILATQAVLVHRTAMQCYRRVAQHDLPVAVSSRLLGSAAALSKTLLRTMRALDRRQERAGTLSPQGERP